MTVEINAVGGDAERVELGALRGEVLLVSAAPGVSSA